MRTTASDSVFDNFCEHSRADRVATDVVILRSLHEAYPGKNIKQISANLCDIVEYAEEGFAEAKLNVGADLDNIITQQYVQPTRRLDQSKGKLQDQITFARWDFSFKAEERLVALPLYKITWTQSNGMFQQQYYLVYGPETCSVDEIDSMLLDVGQWTCSLHEEMYVFDNGRWAKSKRLFKTVKSASWDDVIADPVTKADLRADTEDFFNNRAIYEEYGVPWKRGIILHGPPGNGKTISIKALVAALAKRPTPIPSLYVKSLQSRDGQERSIATIFSHARTMAPCLLVLEDLDSLVTDKLRSYFLNEVDGMENNDGILMIGSTNHLNKLDPAVARRPSRFDRKYFFRQPAFQERMSYARYWGEKLARNKNMQWQDDIESVIASMTEGFSFAYLKELFLLTLSVVANGRIDQGRASAASNTAQDPLDRPTSSDIPRHLENNALLKVMVRQVEILKEEMRLAEETEEEAKANVATPQAADSSAKIASERFASRQAAILGLK